MPKIDGHILRRKHIFVRAYPSILINKSSGKNWLFLPKSIISNALGLNCCANLFSNPYDKKVLILLILNQSYALKYQLKENTSMNVAKLLS